LHSFPTRRSSDLRLLLRQAVAAEQRVEVVANSRLDEQFVRERVALVRDAAELQAACAQGVERRLHTGIQAAADEQVVAIAIEERRERGLVPRLARHGRLALAAAVRDRAREQRLESVADPDA